ncbi:hypothetical protein C8F04DRAFT_487532 [Mycena alexandri]|uniref:Uncharacterized protein n=1 Tax=Mycena alexandri TaxID=1745969 RepID=A0AAD6WLK1_9AGAR|nr:hypothetical protein C8F04DRAFT_487532 [Mycena alexandri]
MAPRAIPTEIFERIMDDLYADLDLRSVGLCALVSSEWTPRSRYLLFSAVDLACSDFSGFLELLGSRTCTLASAVCTLHVDAEPDDGASAEAVCSFVTSWEFGRLARVQSLRLSNIDWTRFSLFEQAAIESGFARLIQLTKIELLSLSFHDLKSALRLASSFPRLTHLRLIDLRFSKYLEYNISSAKTHPIPCAWENVEIESGDAVPAFLGCLCANVAVGIRVLKLVHIDEDHRSRVHEALRFVDFPQCDSFMLSEDTKHPTCVQRK